MASHVQFGVLDHLSDIPGGLQGGTPLVFFDRNNRDTIVLSPSSNFMDTNQATWTTSKGERVIGFGPIGSIKQVTDYEFVFFVTKLSNLNNNIVKHIYHGHLDHHDSFVQFTPYIGYFETTLVVGNGIVDTIQEWGVVLNIFNSRDARLKDFSINYLG